MINWPVFEGLSGDARTNFEKLCRSIIKLNYGRFGDFSALANQPGVEFHLRLERPCGLGDPERWYGWQCRWYELPRATNLGGTRRAKIIDALKKTRKVLPNLTDWVLWTRYPLTKVDQAWFKALRCGPKNARLHLWTSDDVETHLSGDAEVLRHTYFGNLTLLPLELERIHRETTQRIRARWVPEVHEPVEAEQSIQKMLGDVTAWRRFDIFVRSLADFSNALRSRQQHEAGVIKDCLGSLVEGLLKAHRIVEEIRQPVIEGDIDEALKLPKLSHEQLLRPLRDAVRKLRGANSSIALIATNAVSEAREALEAVRECQGRLLTRIVAVVAEAGGGKTQLSAQVTAATPDRPAGILLFGKDLSSGKTLDDLARAITVRGAPISSFELLLSAVDAASQRAGRRLPIVIDGLNESEDPRRWKELLAPLSESLKRYPGVLVVCTLRAGLTSQGNAGVEAYGHEDRPSFVRDSLPESVERIVVPDFGDVTLKVVRKYFAHYRISARDADIPLELLSHPLTLRIFCEVTNKQRQKDVGVESMPRSLTALFDGYLDAAIERAAELARSSRRYLAQDIRDSLRKYGLLLWQSRSRQVAQEELRQELHDEHVPWSESLLNLLEQEGLVIRSATDVEGCYEVAPVYDALGGHLIARALLAENHAESFASLIVDQATVDMLMGDWKSLHPLASDIFKSLVGLYPKRYSIGQLWQVLPESMRHAGLVAAADLEAVLLDAASVSEIRRVLEARGPHSDAFLRALFHSRAAISHPLDSDFLTEVLRGIPMAARDTWWTEWVRKNVSWIEKDAAKLELDWRKEAGVRSRADALRAQWVMWLCTTTHHRLRGLACKALQAYGLGDLQGICGLLNKAEAIDDPYVLEIVLAATYGAALAVHRGTAGQAEKEKAIEQCALTVWRGLCAADARRHSTHVAIRDLALSICELASLISKDVGSLLREDRNHFADEAWSGIPWRTVKAPKKKDGDAPSRTATPFRMDFENYTLGTLVPSRGNYDYSNDDYRLVRERVLWRVKSLGWDASVFEDIDGEISKEQWEYRGNESRAGRVERYGKKYSWIAYFELYGWMRDVGLLSDSRDEVRNRYAMLDPCFPVAEDLGPVVMEDLLAGRQKSIEEWITKGPTPNLKPLLRRDEIRGDQGPWIALDGFVGRQDESRARKMFAFVRSFIVPSADAEEFIRRLKAQDMGGRWLPEKPTGEAIYSGEVPWAKLVPTEAELEFPFVEREVTERVPRKEVTYLLDGKEVSLSPWDLISLRSAQRKPQGVSARLAQDQLDRVQIRERTVTRLEKRKVLKPMKAQSPVLEIRGIGESELFGSKGGVVLAKGLAGDLNLQAVPGSYELRNAVGVRDTRDLSHKLDDFANAERLLYVRQESLERVLTLRNARLVWVIWGEREVSYREFKRRESDPKRKWPAYKVFQEVVALPTRARRPRRAAKKRTKALSRRPPAFSSGWI